MIQSNAIPFLLPTEGLALMELATSVYWRPVESEDRLNRLGLSSSILWEAVEFGYGHAAACTEHDPRVGKGVLTWSKINRGLRDILVPKGWTTENPKNYEMTIHPEGQFAIVVAKGDLSTGKEDQAPMTRARKGPVTQQIIHANQLGFADLSAEWDYANRKRETWILLHRLDPAGPVLRAELSLPSAMNRDGNVNEWKERIILQINDDLSGLATRLPIADPSVDDIIDVPVWMRKRTG